MSSYSLQEPQEVHYRARQPTQSYIYDLEKEANEASKGQIVLKGLDTSSPDGTVTRGLKARHLQMITIGGTIGTGLFVGSGEALASGGPAGLLIGYCIMGLVVYSMMVALGEMATLYPVSGAFTHYSARFVDPALGFSQGWNYWYSYGITLPAEITVAAIVLQYWPRGAELHPAIIISVFLVVILACNFFGVKWYGEAEFWFAIIKVISIIGLIILGVIISAGGGPNGNTTGFHWWRVLPFKQLNGIPGPVGRFLSFCTVFVQAAFSFLGTEIVAITVGEAKHPRKNVPKAIRRVFWRILLFYILGVFVIGINVSPNDERLLTGEGSAASPWVIAIENAGIAVLPSVVNAVVLSSAFSAGNSDLCTNSGIPIWSVGVTSLFGLLSYMNVSHSGAEVFIWFYNISSITGLLTWWTILLTYLRFYYGAKRQGLQRETFPYIAPFQPYLSYFGIVMITLVTVCNGFELFLSGKWNTVGFVVAYITFSLFLGMYLGYKIIRRSKFVSLDAMDFDTGRRELDAMAAEEEEKYVAPHGFVAKFWAWLM